MNNIFKKVSTKLYTFPTIRRFLIKKIALLTYEVMILPNFDVDIIIDSATNEYTQKLELLQKHVIRNIEFCLEYRQEAKYENNLTTFDLTTLYQRYAEHLSTFVYKFKGDYIAIDPQKPRIELLSKNKVKLKSRFMIKTKVQNSPLC